MKIIRFYCKLNNLEKEYNKYLDSVNNNKQKLKENGFKVESTTNNPKWNYF